MNINLLLMAGALLFLMFEGMSLLYWKKPSEEDKRAGTLIVLVACELGWFYLALEFVNLVMTALDLIIRSRLS